MVNFKDTTRAYFCHSQEINRLREEIDRLLSKGNVDVFNGCSLIQLKK